MLRAHPVALDLRVDEALAICWVEVTQLVPTRASPLRHHIDFASISFFAVTKVKFDFQPIGNSRERRHRISCFVVGVEGLRFEISEFRKFDWQQLVWY